MTRQRPWLPTAVAVTADPQGWTVAVQEAETAAELLAGGEGEGAAAVAEVPPGGTRAVYELTALVALIRHARRPRMPGLVFLHCPAPALLCCVWALCRPAALLLTSGCAPCAGWPCRRDEDEAGEAAESGQEYEGHLIAHIKVPPTYFEAQQQSPAAGTPHALSRSASGSNTQAAAADGEGGGSGGPATPRFATVSPQAIASMLLPGAGGGGAAQSPQQQSPQQQQQSPQQQQQSPQQQQPAQQLSGADAEIIRHASDSLAAALSTPHSTHSTPPFR